ncbi:coil containing protein [Vibrio phage 2.275.O._10N.286.54.E11]|nr:coil containing protein [Vibrio phage 2.275.O._10N.286.54.E11]
MGNPLVKLIFIIAVFVLTVLSTPLTVLKNILVALRIVLNSSNTVDFYREVICARKRKITEEEKRIDECRERIRKLMNE